MTVLTIMVFVTVALIIPIMVSVTVTQYVDNQNANKIHQIDEFTL